LADLLICKHALGTKKIGIHHFIISSSLIWFLTPVLGQTCLWVSGSSNYLWPLTLILSFLLPYRLLLDRNVLNKSVYALIMFAGGILAGWSNENSSGAMLLMLIFYLIIYKIKGITIRLWCFSGLLGSIIGFLLMLLAPGVKARLGTYPEDPQLSFFQKYWQRIKNIIWVLSHELNVLLLLVCVALIVLFVLKIYKRSNSIVPIIYGFGACSAIAANVLSPSVPFRGYFGIVFFLYIAVLYVIDSTPLEVLFKKSIHGLLLLLLMIFVMMPTYFSAYLDIAKTNSQITYREIFIEQEKSKGINDIVTSSVAPESKYNPSYELDDISNDVTYWSNVAVARYYNVKSIKSNN
jgi:hypothetical protein